jgi:hypothetical protein
MLDDVVAQEDRCVEVLRQSLDAARHVDRVADDGDLALAGMTHATQDDGTEMNPNADAQRQIEGALELGTQTIRGVLDEQRRPHGVPAGRLRRFLPNAENGENGVADVFIDKAIVVQHRFGNRREMLVQHVHDVIGQVLLREHREIADVREQNGGLNLFPFAGARALQLVEIENDDVLGVIDEEPDDHIPMDFHLAAQSRVVVPTPLLRHFLFPGVEGRKMGRAVQDLDPAGGAARLSAALMVVGYAATNGDAEQSLPFGDILDGDAAVCINDLVHRPLPARKAPQMPLCA